MTKKMTDRFEAEFAPLIAQRVSALFEQRIRIEIIPAGGHGLATRLHLQGDLVEPIARYAYPLNIEMTWDLEEIEYLFEVGGTDKFARYLTALPLKLKAWQVAREIDFTSRSQAQPHVLLGGLDFIG